MNKIPTAEEFYDKSKHDSILDIMIDFAKLHCEKQAKVIAEKGYATKETKQKGFRNLVDGNGNIFGNPVPISSSEYILDKNSILNAYPLDLIK